MKGSEAREPMDEQSLIQQVQEGKLEAFGHLMDLHVRRLRAVVALNAPVPHLVDEIAHEAFVFAYNHIQEFQRGTSFFAWLKSIAWNLLRAEIQRFSREQANQTKYAERRVVEATPFKAVDLSVAILSWTQSLSCRRRRHRVVRTQAALWSTRSAISSVEKDR